MSNVPKIYYNQTPSEVIEIKSKWWQQPEDQMHAHIMGVVKKIRQFQQYRTAGNIRHARLYANLDLVGLQAGMFMRVNHSTMMSLNVIKSCVDTAAAKIAGNKTRPLFLTDDGDWMAKRRAQNLTRFIDGAFAMMGTGQGDERSLYGIARRGFVDSCVFGTGPTRFYIEGKEVKAERILPEEIVVDDTEGMYGQPRQMHQEKLMFREVAADTWPDHADAIKACPSGIDAQYANQFSADMIKVVESWHLPSSEDAGDGKHVFSIENATLKAEDYKKDYFPFLFQRWTPRLVGFYGQGLAEELAPIQLEINKMLRNIQLAMHFIAVPRIWIEMSSQVPAKAITNEIGMVGRYRGTPPIFQTAQAMGPEYYQHLERLIQRAYETTGISQLSAQAQKPSGLNSGEAIRNYHDIETERFKLQAQRMEEWYLDAARVTIDLMDDIAEEYGDVKIRTKEGAHSQALSWKDVKLPKDKYVIRAFPTNILPAEPAGALATAQELIQGGFFERDEALELLDFPDLKAAIGLKLAPRTDLRRMLEKMIEDNEYQTPEPYMDLDLAKTLAQSYYLKGRTDGMPEERLDLLRRFMDDVQTMVMAQQQQQAPMPGPGGAAGGGTPQLAQPAPLPTSDLLPMGGGGGQVPQ